MHIPPDSILREVDFFALLVALGVASLLSLLSTLRARGIQAALNKPLTPLTAVLNDTLLGGILGGFGAMYVVHEVEAFHSGPALLLLAGLFSSFAPNLTDWLREDGVDIVKRLLKRFAGALGEALDEEEKDDDHE